MARLISQKPMAMPIGIVAASSVTPLVEFERGAARLREAGFELFVHEQVSKRDFLFAGTDEERAGALYAYAKDPRFFVIWMARGGYGAQRLLSLLDDLTREHGIPPKKLLVGYSDVTVLHEYARTRWGWSTLHAPMPADDNFCAIAPQEWEAIVSLARGKMVEPPWGAKRLEWITPAPGKPLRAQLIGGNLALWSSLCGTNYLSSARGRLLFLEDIGEAIYRIDRMMTQLAQSGALDKAAGIVLGDFTNCEDEASECLARDGSDERKPLRQKFPQRDAFDQIFGTIGRRTGIPVARGLGVGHGPHLAPLPLGAKYELSPEGKFSLLDWDWIGRQEESKSRPA